MKTKLFFTFMLICLINVVTYGQEKKDEFPKTKISGLIFGDYYYNAVRDSAFNPVKAANVMTGNNALSGKQNESSVQIRRIHFKVNHQLAKNVEAQLILESDQNSKLTSNNMATFIKDAWIKWKYFKGHELIFGVIPTTAYDVPENFWGNRYIEKTVLDLRSLTPNRDFGVSLRGKIDSIGKFKYSLTFGEGAKNAPGVDWYKQYYAGFQYSPILEFNDKNEVTRELSINLYADFKDKPSIVNTYYISDGSKGENNFNGDSKLLSLTAGYKIKDKYSCGLEFYYSSSSSSFQDTASKSFLALVGFGFSVYGTYQINEKINAFARYDYFEPNNHAGKAAKGDTRNYIIAGASYSPVKNFSISPNVLMETYENKVNGITNTDGTKKDQPFKASITPRVTFYYVFK